MSRSRFRVGRGAAVAVALGALAMGGFYACVFSSVAETDPSAATTQGGPSTGAGPSTLDKRELLASLADNVILPTLRDFAQVAAALETATAGYAQSGSSDDRDAAQQAWRDAMSVWQRAELMQIGPAGVMGDVAGGEDLRLEIYSYPLVNPCRVDQELVEGAYVDTSALSKELVNVRGLDALEYLLFYDGQSNACAPQNDINSSGSWNAIVSELPERRAAYAASAAAILSSHAGLLVRAWEPEEGDFLAELAQAGNGSATYPSDQAALNAVSDAMFYLDSETKDMKLAVPAGLSDCVAESCPDALELRWSGFSKQAIIDNLEGTRMLFTGGPRGESNNLGFDDWLIAVGDAGLAIDMVDKLDAAVAAAEAIEHDRLVDALADPADLERVRVVYHAVRAFTDLLKADFITVLDLELPKAAEGDND